MTLRIGARLLWLVVATAVGLGAPGADGALAQAKTRVHTVQPGETLGDIAAAYDLSSVSVMAANALPNADLLHVGQSLVIPPVDGVLHTVQPGETLVGIANHYDVDAADLVAANDLASADDLAVGEVLVVPGVRLAAQAVQAAAAQAEAAVAVPDHGATDRAATADTYVVREGDTLRSIAESLQVDILSLVAMNALDDADLIQPGTRLRVSAHPLEYVVQPGDTVGDIAWRYAVDPDALLRANGVVDPDRIVTGMTLVVPLGAPTRPAQAARPAPSAPAAPARPTAAAAASAPTPSLDKPQPTPVPAPSAPAASASDDITAMVTGYAQGAGAVSTRTASGTTAHWGTVAADTRLYPFGTRLRIEGLGDAVFVVEDTGSAVRGNVFDVWYPDAASARRLGARTRHVTILGPGDP